MYGAGGASYPARRTVCRRVREGRAVSRPRGRLRVSEDKPIFRRGARAGGHGKGARGPAGRRGGRAAAKRGGCDCELRERGGWRSGIGQGVWRVRVGGTTHRSMDVDVITVEPFSTG